MSLQPFETRDSVPGEIHTAVHHNRYVRNAALWLKNRVDTILGYSRKITWEFPVTGFVLGNDAVHQRRSINNWDIFEIELPNSGTPRATFQGITLPTDYDGGTISIIIQWRSAVAGSAAKHRVVWRTIFRRHSTGNNTTLNNITDYTLTASDASNNSSFQLSNGTYLTANQIKETVIDWTGSLPSAGQLLEFKIDRNTGSGSDTMDDVFITKVIMEFEKELIMADRYLLADVDFGDGSDGAMTIAADADTAKQEYNFTTLVINANRTWTVRHDDAPLVVRATESVIINGALDGIGAGFESGNGPGFAIDDRPGASGFFLNAITIGFSRAGYAIPLAEILANDLLNLPEGGSGSNERAGGAIVVIVAPSITIGGSGLIDVRGQNASDQVGGGAGGLAVCIGNTLVFASGAEIDAEGGQGGNTSWVNGQPGGLIALYTRSYTKAGATLPNDVYEKQIFNSLFAAGFFGE